MFYFLTNQRLESDEIQVDLSSLSDTGPWLVLHTITNLVEHLRLDFMKEIRYEAGMSDQHPRRFVPGKASAEMETGRCIFGIFWGLFFDQDVTLLLWVRSGTWLWRRGAAMPPAESADESEERGCGECSGEPWTFVVTPPKC